MVIYFYNKNATKMAKDAREGIIPKHLCYGMSDLEDRGMVKCVDHMWQVLPFSKVIILEPWQAVPLRLMECQVTLININSNHIIERNQYYFRKQLIWFIYSCCRHINCLSDIQFPELTHLKIDPEKVFYNPLGVDEVALSAFKNLKDHKYPEKYFLTSGKDAGRNFKRLIEVKELRPLIIASSNISEDYNNSKDQITHYKNLPYTEYLKLLAESTALVLDIQNGPNSSDCSGSVTALEGTIMEKPVFINPQPWMTDLLPKESFYSVYDYSSYMQVILSFNKFQKRPEQIEKDYEYYSKFTLKTFLAKLLKVINN